MIRVEPSPPLRQTLRVDIVEFLTARLDEDERIAQDACSRRRENNAGEHWRWQHIQDDTDVDFSVEDDARYGVIGGSRSIDRWPVGLRSVERYEPNMPAIGLLPHIVIAQMDEMGVGEAAHIARHDPARVLADVAAKRAIVQRLHHSFSSGIRPGAERYVECTCGWERVLSDRERYHDLDFYQRHLDTLGVTETVSTGILRFLVQPYADHPDFDPAWKVGE